MKPPDANYFHSGPRLTITFAVLIALILGGNGLLVWQFRIARLETDRLTGANQQLILVLRLRENLLIFHQRLDELAQSRDAHRLVTEGETLRKTLLEQTERMKTAVTHLPAEAHVNPDFLPTLQAIEIPLRSQLEAITALATSGDWEAVRLRLARELEPTEALTSALVKSIDQETSGELSRSAVNMSSVQRRIFFLVPSLAIPTFVIALFFAWAIARHMIELQEEKFREAAETMPALAFVADLRGNRTFSNRGWLEYTGLSSEQASGSGWEKVIHSDDLNRIAERWRASGTTGQPLDCEARLRRGSDGVYRWFLIRAVPVQDKHGKIVKWCGAATDIEDRKRAEQEREKLRQLEAELAHINRVSTLGEMAASLAHEIKQPIAAAITSATSCMEWLAHEPPNLDRARAAAARIDKYGNRAAEIIDRIRSFYKKSPPQHELADVNGIIQEMLTLLKCEADRYSVAMRTELAAELPKIMADRVQLQQVFMNLMLNGIEAMKDSGGELTVKSQLQNGQLQFSVSDTGVGLPKEKMDQIFSAFFTTKPQGSGMGLSISRSIVESHGGQLWATANDGRGATFHFTLPTAAEILQVSATGT